MLQDVVGRPVVAVGIEDRAGEVSVEYVWCAVCVQPEVDAAVAAAAVVEEHALGRLLQLALERPVFHRDVAAGVILRVLQVVCLEGLAGRKAELDRTERERRLRVIRIGGHQHRKLASAHELLNQDGIVPAQQVAGLGRQGGGVGAKACLVDTP